VALSGYVRGTFGMGIGPHLPSVGMSQPCPPIRACGSFRDGILEALTNALC
jgi:hypothetical protein